MLAVGMTLVGVFAAIYHPVGTAMLVAYAQNRGREIGVNGMWGNLGVAFSALLTGFLVAQFGWRSAFILPGCISILIGLMFALQVKDEPIPMRAHTAPKGRSGQRISMVMVFSVLAIATATGGVVFNATTMTYPKLFQDRLHDLFASPQTLGLIVSLAYAFGAVAQLTIGRFLDRFSLKWPFVILTVCQAPFLFGLAYTDSWPVVLLGAGFMFVVFGQVTVNDAMVANFVAPQWQSRVFALRYFLSFGASATAIPLIAFVEPRQGLTGLYVILAGFAALTFAAALIFPRTPAENPVAQPA
jgi:MFS family permease